MAQIEGRTSYTQITSDGGDVTGSPDWNDVTGKPTGIFSSSGEGGTTVLDNEAVVGALGYTPFDEAGGELTGNVGIGTPAEANTRLTIKENSDFLKLLDSGGAEVGSWGTEALQFDGDLGLGTDPQARIDVVGGGTGDLLNLRQADGTRRYRISENEVQFLSPTEEPWVDFRYQDEVPSFARMDANLGVQSEVANQLTSSADVSDQVDGEVRLFATNDNHNDLAISTQPEGGALYIFDVETLEVKQLAIRYSDYPDDLAYPVALTYSHNGRYLHFSISDKDGDSPDVKPCKQFVLDRQNGYSIVAEDNYGDTIRTSSTSSELYPDQFYLFSTSFAIGAPTGPVKRIDSTLTTLQSYGRDATHSDVVEDTEDNALILFERDAHAPDNNQIRRHDLNTGDLLSENTGQETWPNSGPVMIGDFLYATERRDDGLRKLDKSTLVQMQRIDLDTAFNLREYFGDVIAVERFGEGVIYRIDPDDLSVAEIITPPEPVGLVDVWRNNIISSGGRIYGNNSFTLVSLFQYTFRTINSQMEQLAVGSDLRQESPYAFRAANSQVVGSLDIREQASDSLPERMLSVQGETEGDFPVASIENTVSTPNQTALDNPAVEALRLSATYTGTGDLISTDFGVGITGGVYNAFHEGDALVSWISGMRPVARLTGFAQAENTTGVLAQASSFDDAHSENISGIRFQRIGAQDNSTYDNLHLIDLRDEAVFRDPTASTENEWAIFDDTALGWKTNSDLITSGNVEHPDWNPGVGRWGITAEGDADFRNIYADELTVQTFTAELTQSLAGSDILTESAADLNKPYSGEGSIEIETPAEVQENAFGVGNTLRMRYVDRSSGGLQVSDVWLEVTDTLSVGGDVEVYQVNELQAPSSYTIRKGARVLDYGQPGDTIIERTVNGPGAPFDRIVTWQPDSNGVPDAYTTISQIGNIGNVSDASTGIYTESARFTNDIRIGDLSGSYLEFDGQLTIVTADHGDLDGAISTIQTNVSDNAASISAVASTQSDQGDAISALEIDVSSNEDGISSNASLISQLDTDLGNVESGLQTQIDANVTDITSNLSLINDLETDTETLSAGLELLTQTGANNIYGYAGEVYEWDDRLETDIPHENTADHGVAGEYVSLSVDLRSTSGTQSGRAKLRDVSRSDDIGTFFNGESVTENWQTFSGTVFIPEDVTTIEIHFVNDSTDAPMQRRRVMLHRGQTPRPFSTNPRAEAAFSLSAENEGNIASVEGRVTDNESEINLLTSNQDSLSAGLELLTKTGQQNLLQGILSESDMLDVRSQIGGSSSAFVAIYAESSLEDLQLEVGDTFSVSMELSFEDPQDEGGYVEPFITARDASGDTIEQWRGSPGRVDTDTGGDFVFAVQEGLVIPEGTAKIRVAVNSGNVGDHNIHKVRNPMLVRGPKAVGFAYDAQALAAFNLSAENESGLASVEGRVTDAEATLDQTVSYDGNTAGIFLTADGDGTSLELDADQILISGSVTADSIAANSITADEIAVGALSADNIDVDSIFATNAVIDGSLDIRQGALQIGDFLIGQFEFGSASNTVDTFATVEAENDTCGTTVESHTLTNSPAFDAENGLVEASYEVGNISAALFSNTRVKVDVIFFDVQGGEIDRVSRTHYDDEANKEFSATGEGSPIIASVPANVDKVELVRTAIADSIDQGGLCTLDSAEFVGTTEITVSNVQNFMSDKGLVYTFGGNQIILDGEAGIIEANTKNFLIPHPTKENYKLRHSTLEGPEQGTYHRGTSTDPSFALPDYWATWDDYTVHLTAQEQGSVWVEAIEDGVVQVGQSRPDIEYCYLVIGKRGDIVVEEMI